MPIIAEKNNIRFKKQRDFLFFVRKKFAAIKNGIDEINNIIVGPPVE